VIVVRVIVFGGAVIGGRDGIVGVAGIVGGAGIVVGVAAQAVVSKLRARTMNELAGRRMGEVHSEQWPFLVTSPLLCLSCMSLIFVRVCGS
jgi:hypothetical protein